MAIATECPVRQRLYIAGAPGGSSIGPPIHDYIGQQLGRPWTMQFLKRKTVQNVVDLFRNPDFAGGIVTMPWKKAIIPYLDEADDLVTFLGACNMVVLTPEGQLKGTNVDWVSIEILLLQARLLQGATAGMIYGAGGASRAALHVLAHELNLETIYAVNRDEQEVEDFLKDAAKYQKLVKANVVHVKTVREAEGLTVPSYIVSTVPDLEAKTQGEMEARNILRKFLSRGQGGDGVLLDMCYHPRVTRNLQLGQGHGWTTIEGVEVVGNQFRVQWELWTGQKVPDEVERAAISLLGKMAEADKSVTPDPREYR